MDPEQNTQRMHPSHKIQIQHHLKLKALLIRGVHFMKHDAPFLSITWDSNLSVGEWNRPSETDGFALRYDWRWSVSPFWFYSGVLFWWWLQYTVDGRKGFNACRACSCCRQISFARASHRYNWSPFIILPIKFLIIFYETRLLRIAR